MSDSWDAETITSVFLGFAIFIGIGYYAHYSDKKKADKQKAEREVDMARRRLSSEFSKLNSAAQKQWDEGRYAESIEIRKKELAKWKEYERFILDVDHLDDDDLRVMTARDRIRKLEAIVADPKY